MPIGRRAGRGVIGPRPVARTAAVVGTAAVVTQVYAGAVTGARTVGTTDATGGD